MNQFPLTTEDHFHPIPPIPGTVMRHPSPGTLSHRTGKSCLAALIAGLLTTACNRGPQAAPQMPPPEVATVTVITQPVLLTTELPGGTAPFRIGEIRHQVNGLIQKRLFTEGADVKQGDPLYQIDPAPFQATLENAKAALARSESQLFPAQIRADRYKQ